MRSASTESTLEDVLAILETEGRSRQKKILLSRLSIALAFLSLLGVAALSFIWGREVNVALLVVVIGGCGSAVGYTREHFIALLQATSLNDPALVPHLLDAMESENQTVKQESRRALARLLPSVTADQSASLLPRHRGILVSLVKSLDDQLAQGSLSALIHVGDSAAAKELEEWAAKRSSGDPREDKMKALALQSAGDLRMRLAREIIASASKGPGQVSGDDLHVKG